jgi:hypothetical protein
MGEALPRPATRSRSNLLAPCGTVCSALGRSQGLPQEHGHLIGCELADELRRRSVKTGSGKLRSRARGKASTEGTLSRGSQRSRHSARLGDECLTYLEIGTANESSVRPDRLESEHDYCGSSRS